MILCTGDSQMITRHLGGGYRVYGFGFRESSQEFVMVCLSKSETLEITYGDIFSSRSNRWRRIFDFPYGSPYHNCGKFAQSDLFWLASMERRPNYMVAFDRNSPWFLVRFNIESENYSLVQAPPFEEEEGEYNLTLGILNDHLSLLCNIEDIRANIWVLDHLENSWTKVLTMLYPDEQSDVQYSPPIYVFSNGDVLVEYGSKMVIYNSKDHQARVLQILNFSGCIEAEIYVETLISPTQKLKVKRATNGNPGYITSVLKEFRSETEDIRDENVRKRAGSDITSVLKEAVPRCRITRQDSAVSDVSVDGMADTKVSIEDENTATAEDQVMDVDVSIKDQDAVYASAEGQDATIVDASVEDHGVAVVEDQVMDVDVSVKDQDAVYASAEGQDATIVDASVEDHDVAVVEDQASKVIACVLCRGHDFSRTGFGPRTVILCDQCEKEYHVGCLKKRKRADLKELPMGEWFCCRECSRVYNSLQNLLVSGAQKLSDSLLDTIRKKHNDKGLEGVTNMDVRFRLLSSKISSRENRLLLSEACAIFHDRFDPIVDSATGRDYIPSMVYGRNIRGQDFSGMYCAILTVNSTVMSAGLLRVLGRDIAELPLVATTKENQGKGYFQLLFSCIEKLLAFLEVQSLVLPAAEEAESIWTHKLGFNKIPEDQLNNYKKRCWQMLTFKGTAMLEKAVPRCRITRQDSAVSDVSVDDMADTKVSIEDENTATAEDQVMDVDVSIKDQDAVYASAEGQETLISPTQKLEVKRATNGNPGDITSVLKEFRSETEDIRDEIVRKRAGSDITSVLKEWWRQHSKWPYPTAEEKKAALKKIPEQVILSEVRHTVEEMQALNKKLEETEAAIDKYFSPEAEVIVKMQLEGEEKSMT